MRKIFILICVFAFSIIITGCQSENQLPAYDHALLDTVLSDASEISNLYSVSVSIDGEIIAEEYYGYRKDSYNANVFSVTKSVTSLLVGIAIDKGYIDSVNQSIGDFIDLSIYNNQEELEEITLKHLLTMSAGLVWDSNNLSSEMINLRGTTNALGFILEREMGFTPGTRFNYSDGSAHLVSYILEAATGMTSHDFAIEHLFTPLGIEESVWYTDRQQIPIGGCDLFLKTDDMIIIGNLVLNDGYYNDTQIVSKDWLTTSTTNQIGAFANHGYGYFWWLSSSNGHDLISARGWGGQQIYIVKDLNLVITTQSNGNVADQSAHTQYDEIESLILNELLPIFIE